MAHWPFVLGAYALVLVGTGGITALSFAAMRRAERRADELTARR